MPAAQSGSAGTGGHLVHVLNRAQSCGFPMVHYGSSCPDLLRPLGPMLLTLVFTPREFNSPVVELIIPGIQKTAPLTCRCIKVLFESGVRSLTAN